MSETFWGKRHPGQNTIVQDNVTTNEDGVVELGPQGTTILYDPSLALDWLKLPDDEILQEWAGRRVRVVRSDHSAHCVTHQHKSVWHWTESPFIVVECPNCQQFQLTIKP